GQLGRPGGELLGRERLRAAVQERLAARVEEHREPPGELGERVDAEGVVAARRDLLLEHAVVLVEVDVDPVPAEGRGALRGADGGRGATRRERSGDLGARLDADGRALVAGAGGRGLAARVLGGHDEAAREQRAERAAAHERAVGALLLVEPRHGGDLRVLEPVEDDDLLVRERHDVGDLPRGRALQRALRRGDVGRGPAHGLLGHEKSPPMKSPAAESPSPIASPTSDTAFPIVSAALLAKSVTCPQPSARYGPGLETKPVIESQLSTTRFPSAHAPATTPAPTTMPMPTGLVSMPAIMSIVPAPPTTDRPPMTRSTPPRQPSYWVLNIWLTPPMTPNSPPTPPAMRPAVPRPPSSPIASSSTMPRAKTDALAAASDRSARRLAWRNAVSDWPTFHVFHPARPNEIAPHAVSPTSQIEPSSGSSPPSGPPPGPVGTPGPGTPGDGMLPPSVLVMNCSSALRSTASDAWESVWLTPRSSATDVPVHSLRNWSASPPCQRPAASTSPLTSDVVLTSWSDADCSDRASLLSSVTSAPHIPLTPCAVPSSLEVPCPGRRRRRRTVRASGRLPRGPSRERWGALPVPARGSRRARSRSAPRRVTIDACLPRYPTPLPRPTGRPPCPSPRGTRRSRSTWPGRARCPSGVSTGRPSRAASSRTPCRGTTPRSRASSSRAGAVRCSTWGRAEASCCRPSRRSPRARPRPRGARPTCRWPGVGSSPWAWTCARSR